MAKKQLQKAFGFMSGTSADGADVALIATDGENAIEFFGGLTLPYDRDLRARAFSKPRNTTCRCSNSPASSATLRCITPRPSPSCCARCRKTRPKEPNLIGFHGHTVRHIASEQICWQISNPWLLAEKTGMRVVSDFRRHDVAVGGQGAPLVGMFHRALFANEPRPTVILNLGGVANITWLGENEEIIAGDTGPGCGLLDEWIQEMAGQSHDKDGRIALQGKVNEGLVAAALATPFFSKPLPRSADRFDFDHVDVSGMSVEDGAATLCAVTVRAIVKAVKQMPKPPASVWVTGGGVHHPVIMRMLTESFRQCAERSPAEPQSRHARSRVLRLARGTPHEGLAADDSRNHRLQPPSLRRRRSRASSSAVGVIPPASNLRGVRTQICASLR